MNENVETETEEVRKHEASLGVCKCGHGKEAHGAGWRALGGGTEDANPLALAQVGEDECVLVAAGSTSGWLCGCEGYQEIAKVSSLFPFKRGEYGDGRRHTLVQGFYMLVQAGGIFIWSEEGGPDCEGEECSEKALPPFPLREDGKWAFGIGETTVLCKECYDARRSG